MRFVILMLALLATGCSTTRPGVPLTLIDSANAACVEPRFTGKTNLDLAVHALDTKRALRACRAGVESLSNYLKGAQ